MLVLSSYFLVESHNLWHVLMKQVYSFFGEGFLVLWLGFGNLVQGVHHLLKRVVQSHNGYFIEVAISNMHRDWPCRLLYS